MGGSTCLDDTLNPALTSCLRYRCGQCAIRVLAGRFAQLLAILVRGGARTGAARGGTQAPVWSCLAARQFADTGRGLLHRPTAGRTSPRLAGTEGPLAAACADAGVATMTASGAQVSTAPGMARSRASLIQASAQNLPLPHLLQEIDRRHDLDSVPRRPPFAEVNPVAGDAVSSEFLSHTVQSTVVSFVPPG